MVRVIATTHIVIDSAFRSGFVSGSFAEVSAWPRGLHVMIVLRHQRLQPVTNIVPHLHSTSVVSVLEIEAVHLRKCHHMTSPERVRLFGVDEIVVSLKTLVYWFNGVSYLISNVTLASRPSDKIVGSIIGKDKIDHFSVETVPVRI